MFIEWLSYHDLLIFHAACTLFMTGLIWVIQLVHYPLFAYVGSQSYQDYQILHMKRITWIVGPMMIAELGCALLWLFNSNHQDSLIAWLSLVLLGFIWLSTILFQVPAHTKLTQNWDVSAHTYLVKSNWIRTMAWSIRAFLVLWVLRS